MTREFYMVTALALMFFAWRENVYDSLELPPPLSPPPTSKLNKYENAEADKSYRDLDYCGYHKNRI